MDTTDPFLRWRMAQAENARTLAAIAETCRRIAVGQAALARALVQARDRRRDRVFTQAAPESPPTEGPMA